jgi:hypothetical protein
MIGVMVAAVAVVVMIGVMVNAYITTRRLSSVLSDVEEIIHADFKGLEEKIETALLKIRIAESKGNRD